MIAILLGTASWQGFELQRRYKKSQEQQEQLQSLQMRLDEAKKHKLDLSQPAQQGGSGQASSPQSKQMREEQLRGVKQLADTYQTSFREAVRLWPGMTPKRRDLLDHDDRYLRDLEPLASQDPKAAEQLARAWLWLANLQGNPQTINLQDRTGAVASIHEADSLLKRWPSPPKEIVDQVQSAMQQIEASQK